MNNYSSVLGCQLSQSVVSKRNCASCLRLFTNLQTVKSRLYILRFLRTAPGRCLTCRSKTTEQILHNSYFPSILILFLYGTHYHPKHRLLPHFIHLSMQLWNVNYLLLIYLCCTIIIVSLTWLHACVSIHAIHVNH